MSLQDLLGGQPVTADKLDAIRSKAREMRDLGMEIEDLQARLKEMNAQLQTLRVKTLPDLMAEAGVDIIGLEAEGNMPPWDFRSKPFYKANIAADWDEVRQGKAFQELMRCEAGDLIRSEVKVVFNKEELKKAQQLVARLEKAGFTPGLKMSVPHNTLSAWLKDVFQRHSADESVPTPNLDAIGATVGNIVEGKERKK